MSVVGVQLSCSNSHMAVTTANEAFAIQINLNAFIDTVWDASSAAAITSGVTPAIFSRLAVLSPSSKVVANLMAAASDKPASATAATTAPKRWPGEELVQAHTKSCTYFHTILVARLYGGENRDSSNTPEGSA